MRMTPIHLALVLLVNPLTSADASPTRRDDGRPGPGEPTAVVCSVTGDAWLLEAGREEARGLRLLDILTPEATVRTGPDSEVRVTFWDGQRFLFGHETEVQIVPTTVDTHVGTVRALPPVGVRVPLEPIADAAAGPGRETGRRLCAECASRSEGLSLDPPTGSVVTANQLTLSFSALGGDQVYRVSVERPWGAPVLEALTRATSLSIPDGTVEAGQVYHWHVRTTSRDHPVVCASGVFTTLGLSLIHI